MDRVLARRIFDWRASQGASPAGSRVTVNKAAIGLLIALRQKGGLVQEELFGQAREGGKEEGQKGGWIQEEPLGPDDQDEVKEEGPIAAVGLSGRVWLCCAISPLGVRVMLAYAEGEPVLDDGEQQALDALFGPGKWAEIALACRSARERALLAGKAPLPAGPAACGKKGL